MDAVSIATTCYFPPCSGSGPWVEADMENGMFQGGNGSNTANTGQNSTFATVTLQQQRPDDLLAAERQRPDRRPDTWWNGSLPTQGGYQPMHQEGGIILGTGGDNSNRNMGTFFEGVMTSRLPERRGRERGAGQHRLGRLLR